MEIEREWPLIRLRREPEGHLVAPVGAICAEVKEEGMPVIWIKRRGADAYGWEKA